MKICDKCKKEKEDLDFSSNKTNKDGLSRYCKNCCNSYGKKYREENKDKIKKQKMEKSDYYKRIRKEYYQKYKNRELASSKKWYYENKDHQQELKGKYRETLCGRIVFWKNGAKKRNLEWSLTNDYIEELTRPMVCYYTNEPVTLERNKLNTISLDRIDSNKGYTKENVVVCQQIINKMKSDLSNDEFVMLCKKVTENIK
jgi:hypothetical protein